MSNGPVVLLVRSLNAGGAERQVVELASGLHRRGVRVVVLTFYDGGALAGDLERAGVSRVSLGKGGRWDLIRFSYRLIAALRRIRPSVLYSFLSTANILAVLSKPWLRGTLVVWGIRASSLDLSKYDLMARMALRLEALLASVPDLTIANSDAGRRHAVSLGFPGRRLVVVYNGIDTSRFRHDAAGRHRIRAEWEVREQDRLVGLVARLDPMKDHGNFLRAAGMVASRVPDVRFVCVGDGSPELRQSLEALATELGLERHVIWSGRRQDMPAVLSALDVACSASAFGEGFSNAIAEAMSSGVPCIGTDVGDTATVLGDAGLLVPPGDSRALAGAIIDLLEMDAHALQSMRDRARRRVVENFSADSMVDRTLESWAKVRGFG